MVPGPIGRFQLRPGERLVYSENMKTEEYDRLIRALQLVALPFEKQIEFLPDFINQPDEIAIRFDDAFRAVEPENKALTRMNVAELLNELDGLFEDMSGKQEMWTLEALEKYPYWQRSRELAKASLKALDEPLALPKSDDIQYMKG